MRSAAYNNRVLGPERQAPIGEGYEPAAELTTSVRRVCGRARVKCRPIVPTTALDPIPAIRDSGKQPFDHLRQRSWRVERCDS